MKENQARKFRYHQPFLRHLDVCIVDKQVWCHRTWSSCEQINCRVRDSCQISTVLLSGTDIAGLGVHASAATVAGSGLFGFHGDFEAERKGRRNKGGTIMYYIHQHRSFYEDNSQRSGVFGGPKTWPKPSESEFIPRTSQCFVLKYSNRTHSKFKICQRRASTLYDRTVDACVYSDFRRLEAHNQLLATCTGRRLGPNFPFIEDRFRLYKESQFHHPTRQSVVSIVAVRNKPTLSTEQHILWAIELQ